MRLPGRKISILFRRNESKDEQLAGIEYTGYDLYWPSGARSWGWPSTVSARSECGTFWVGKSRN